MTTQTVQGSSPRDVAGPLPRRGGRQAAPPPPARFLLPLLLLLASSVIATSSSSTPKTSEEQHAGAFWHYALAVGTNGSSGSAALQVVWSAIPARSGGKAAARYALQCWPTAAMPASGDDGWKSSLVDLQPDFDSTDGMHVDEVAVAEEDGTATGGSGSEDGGPGGGLPFYRVLVMAADGAVLAATEAARAFDAAESVVVSPRPCASGPCRRLLQQPTLQAAINGATDGSTVLVQPGTYSGQGNVELAFGGRRITLQAVAGPAATTIDCGGAARAFNFGANDSGVVVRGFRVVNGAADSGGCASIDGSSPTISNCRFERCTAALSGGGLAVSGAGAAPLIQDTRFVGCFSIRGAGVYVTNGAGITMERCSLEGNVGAIGVGVGGGLLLAGAAPSLLRDTNITGSRVGFTGGGLAAESGSSVTMVRVKIRDNYSSSHAGGALLFGSNMTAVDCEFSNNTAALFGGALLAQYGMYNASGTAHVGNRAYLGGGAVKLYAAVGILRNCQVVGNIAPYGAGIEVARIPDPNANVTVPTVISVQDSLIQGNVVTDRGAGVFVDSADQAVFVNTTITNNMAGARGGGLFCNAPTPVQLIGSQVLNNSAPTGGGIFALTNCSLSVSGSRIRHNSASEFGAGVAVADGAAVNITNSQVWDNGVASCSVQRAPLGGGGIFIGVQTFQPSSDCQAAGEAPQARVTLAGVSLQRNTALDRGGGVLVAAGLLEARDTELSGNKAVGGSNLDGVGGALALDERCSAVQGVCAAVGARLSNVSLSANTAAAAGGGVFFNGTSGGSSLSMQVSRVNGNAAGADLRGAGGGLFLGHPAFSLLNTSLANNTAFYGGGLFLATSLDPLLNTLSGLGMSGNKAKGMGASAFWLRSSSAVFAFQCQACSLPLGTRQVSTEALTLEYGAEPAPEQVQPNRPFPPFSVQLKDFYGAVVTTENGTATVTGDTANVTAGLAALGTEASLRSGRAEFTGVQLKGTINQTYQLQILYASSSGGASKFLPPSALPPLALPVTVAPCAAGSQPNSDRNDCTECAAGTYNLDGMECLPCPKGATCKGGPDLASQPGFWRASPLSAAFYGCKSRGACKGTNEAGDGACAPGQMGPLCDICWQGYFKYAGACRECRSTWQSVITVVIAAVALPLLVLALFARNWDFGSGPGIMTKVKIFLTHFQMIALFRDYDVVWPGATRVAMRWAELANIGVVMVAPECYFPHYNFYTLYIAQMLLPAVAVLLCVAIFYAAELALRMKDPRRDQRGAGAAAGGAIGWLEGLKIRCWKNAFWFVTLLYPRCAMTALQLFGWRKLESGTYLEADLSILVKYADGRFSGTFVGFMLPGIFILVTFAALIPLFWFLTVWRHRHQLEDPLVQAKFGFLYSSYSPRLPYWETTEMVRKFAIAFIPVFVPTQVDGSLQAAVGQAVLLLYIMLTLKLWPFAAGLDNWLQLASLTVLWLLLLTSGVNKWADLDPAGSRALAGFQLAASSGVGFLLGVAIAFSAWGLARQFTATLAARRRKAKGGSDEDGDPDGKGEDGGEGPAGGAEGGSTGDGEGLAAGEDGSGSNGGEAVSAAGYPPGWLPIKSKEAGDGLLGSASRSASGSWDDRSLLDAEEEVPLRIKHGSGTLGSGAYWSASGSLKRGSGSTATTAAFVSAVSSFRKRGSLGGSPEKGTGLAGLGGGLGGGSEEGEITAARPSPPPAKPCGISPSAVCINVLASPAGDAGGPFLAGPAAAEDGREAGPPALAAFELALIGGMGLAGLAAAGGAGGLEPIAELPSGSAGSASGSGDEGAPAAASASRRSSGASGGSSARSSVFAEGEAPPPRRRLGRTSSNMSRRSVADDLEVQLALPAVLEGLPAPAEWDDLASLSQPGSAHGSVFSRGSVFAEGEAPQRSRLGRTSSTVSRRSVADDLELPSMEALALLAGVDSSPGSSQPGSARAAGARSSVFADGEAPQRRRLGPIRTSSNFSNRSRRSVADDLELPTAEALGLLTAGGDGSPSSSQPGSQPGSARSAGGKRSSVFAEGEAPQRRRLGRTSSNMSRRSVADDQELQLALPAVLEGRADSSPFLMPPAPSAVPVVRPGEEEALAAWLAEPGSRPVG